MVFISDLKTLHSYWMSLLFSRQLNPHPVLGKHKPENKKKLLLYKLWAFIGLPFIVFAYPITLVGYIINYIVSTLSRIGRTFGVGGTFGILGLLWTAITLVTGYYYGLNSAIAVVTSSFIALFFMFVTFYVFKNGSELTKVLIGYPSGYITLFLPPITAAVMTPIMGEQILIFSDELSQYILNNVARSIGMEEYFRQNFTLEGIYHIILWSGISLFTGWLTGVSVFFVKLVSRN